MNTLGETSSIAVSYANVTQSRNNGYVFIAVVEEINHDGFVVCGYNAQSHDFVTWVGVPGCWSSGRYKHIGTAHNAMEDTRKAALQDMMCRAGITSKI